jgi:hypothetical protein
MGTLHRNNHHFSIPSMQHNFKETNLFNSRKNQFIIFKDVTRILLVEYRDHYRSFQKKEG